MAEALNLTPPQVTLWNDYVAVHQAAVGEHLLWLREHPLKSGITRQGKQQERLRKRLKARLRFPQNKAPAHPKEDRRSIFSEPQRLSLKRQRPQALRASSENNARRKL